MERRRSHHTIRGLSYKTRATEHQREHDAKTPSAFSSSLCRPTDDPHAYTTTVNSGTTPFLKGNSSLLAGNSSERPHLSRSGRRCRPDL